MTKAQTSDYIPYDGKLARILRITENDGYDIYHLDDGHEVTDECFDVDDIRLESEVFENNWRLRRA